MCRLYTEYAFCAIQPHTQHEQASLIQISALLLDFNYLFVLTSWLFCSVLS